jgi:hypothetical protein
MKIHVIDDYGHERADVTESVQIIYDALMGSMDAGSGFLDAEEEQALRKIAKVCGFDDPTFGSDPCKCSHTRERHSSTGRCWNRVVISPPRYERQTLQRLVASEFTPEQETVLRERLRQAKDSVERNMVLAGAATMLQAVVEEYEGTVMVSDAEYEQCECTQFMLLDAS